MGREAICCVVCMRFLKWKPDRADDRKLPYRRPMLTRYGTVREITTAKGSKRADALGRPRTRA